MLVVFILTFMFVPSIAKGAEKAGEKTTGSGYLTRKLTEAINGFISNMIEQAINPTLDFLGRYLLSTPDITEQEGLKGIWSSMRLITNSFFVLIVIIGAIVMAASDHLGFNAYEIRVLAPRILWGFIASNMSLWTCSLLIELNNGLVKGVVGTGIDPKNISIFKFTSVSAISSGLIFTPLLALIGVILLIMVAIIYVIRLGLIWVLVILSPLAFALWVLPQTQFLTKMWSRAFFATVFIQFMHALILMVFIRLQFEGSFWETFVGIACLYLIVKVPRMLLDASLYSEAQPNLFRGMKSVLRRGIQYVQAGQEG